MWAKFNVTADHPYCDHINDDGGIRKLFFASDFPHIIKNLWQWIVSKKDISFFSRKVSSAMRMYQSRHSELVSCDKTVTFIDRIAELIHAFSSRNGLSAIKNNNDCPEKKVIEEFLAYLNMANSRNICFK